ncbi:divergent polysaccharide deacetylase family protein [Escherichia coli]
MSSDEIERIIRSAVNGDYAVGINNHMGSKMTSNLFGMQKVMQELERYDFYFLDSVIIGNTQPMRAAQGTGVKVIKRQVFLDDSQTKRTSVIGLMHRLARRNGSTIAIGILTGNGDACYDRWFISCRQTLRCEASSLLNEPQVDIHTAEKRCA